jgi:hypothetical protein
MNLPATVAQSVTTHCGWHCCFTGCPRWFFSVSNWLKHSPCWEGNSLHPVENYPTFYMNPKEMSLPLIPVLSLFNPLYLRWIYKVKTDIATCKSLVIFHPQHVQKTSYKSVACITFCNMLIFYGEGFVAPHRAPHGEVGGSLPCQLSMTDYSVYATIKNATAASFLILLIS